MGEPIALAGYPCPELFSAAPHESKGVPQRLKPSSAQTITARLNPCPSFDSLCPSLSGAVQIAQPKNLKPDIITITYGRPEGRPLQRISFFPRRGIHTE